MIHSKNDDYDYGWGLTHHWQVLMFKEDMYPGLKSLITYKTILKMNLSSFKQCCKCNVYLLLFHYKKKFLWKQLVLALEKLDIWLKKPLIFWSHKLQVFEQGIMTCNQTLKTQLQVTTFIFSKNIASIYACNSSKWLGFEKQEIQKQ